MIAVDTKEAIKKEAERLGIDVLGFASCEPFYDTLEVLKKREALGYLSGFEEKDIEKRITPHLALKGCRTIIAGGISYNVDKGEVRTKENYRHRVSISRGAWGMDYHRVLKGKLQSLAAFINEKMGGSTEVFVDTGPLVEREVARRAGIGYVGKNCSLINPEYGSYIFLGEILTDIFIEPDKPLPEDCGDCDLCLQACPSGALRNPYTVNAKECVSYMTQSKDVSCDYYGSIGSSIYGCDVCQIVCPRNRSANKSRHREFVPEDWNAYPDAVDILEMDNKTFENTFKKTSSGWRGKKTLQRNALIALGNSGKKENAEYIEKMLHDSRRDIRKTGIYALHRLLGKDSIPIFKKYIEREEDDELKSLMQGFINHD